MSVFTPVSKQQLIDHLHQYYTIGELIDYEGITAGIENTNYFVSTNQGEFVLTLFEAHSVEKLSFYLGLMAHLGEANIPSIQAIPSKYDTLLHELNGKPASFIKRIAGVNPVKINQSHCTQIGEMLARFHIAAQYYPQQMENEFDLAWQKTTVESWVDKIPADDAALLQSELAHQFNHQAQTNTLPSGIIHGDLFRDNSLFNADKLSAILDLYTACNDTLLIDLAIVINDWCFNEGKLEGTLVDTFVGTLDEALASRVIAAYQSIRPLEDSEKESFNDILRASALRFWILRLDLKYNPRQPETSPNAYSPDEYKQKLLKHIDDKDQIMRLLNDV